ncbi:hypothetical protein FPZ24_08230 [Sphingomonas panacisoli]|uniref:SF3 helicase domain-containing protein n=1 Tax=Sphingomonas panacisoli TaxID=1813879 RepID=A0A5B8LK43_9SPHN|nr:phage/plasmid primase, P4 family [Sphingomonas panacisoli]QDZ07470.1 hypothetical protein FPZ24_08230 [Sphingomonas panacisoli]
MRDQDYTAAADFLKRFFTETLHNVELRACANERTGGARSVFSRQENDILGFCRANDKPGWGTYFGVCTRGKERDDGSAANAMECPALWVDIDCAAQGIAGDHAIQVLQFLPLPPSIIVNSGGGLHAYWLLEDKTDVSEASATRTVVVQALKALVHILAGDPKCADIARIMRLPGTFNSKAKTVALYDGEPALCEVVEDSGRVYDLDALIEWLSEQRVMLRGQIEAPRPVRADDPFLSYAKEAGYEPAIDIDAELAAMAHGAPGRNSIHETQIRVAYSMIARGYDDDEIVDRILAATEAAAPSDQRWNWTAEETAIRRDLAKARPKQAAAPRAAPMIGNTALKLVHDADVVPAPKPKPDDRQTQIVTVGKAVIAVWNERYGPIMHTAGTTYVYEGGIWLPWNDPLAQRLRAMIQEACQSLSINPTTSILNAAKAYIMDRPELRRDEVAFDDHGLLIAEDAALDLRTLQVLPHSPEHYALFKVAARVNGSQACPTWKAFLNDAFADRSAASEIIATLQEWFGASVAVIRSRPLLKGLLVHGPSRSGKTQVSQVARGILGLKHICNARMRDLEGRFGLEPLIGKRGWIADDAIGAKEYLDAETYKVVVTGETTSAQMKGGKNIEVSFGFPVMLTANNLPRVNDKSDATYNRSLILPMTVVRPEDAPEPIGYQSLAAKVIAEELTGVLWWAIAGRQRLEARGRFDPPAAMSDAGRSFQDSNDPIGSWIRQCVEPSRDTKVARKDLSTSFNGWWEMESDDGKPFSSNSVTRMIGERFPGLADLKLSGERLFGGIRLNEEGLFAWESRVKGAGFDKKPAFSSAREEVNRHWEGNAPKKEGNRGKTVF